MPDLINYVAVCGEYAVFGIAEDPAAPLAAMQVGNPYPIELIAGWVLSPADRAVVLDKVRASLRRHRIHVRQGDWFKVPQQEAVDALAQHALAYQGKAWRVRKRPLPSDAQDNAHFRPVMTPRGRFPSAGAAAHAFGYSRQAAWERAARRAGGWRFLDDTSPESPPARRGRPPKEKSPALE